MQMRQSAVLVEKVEVVMIQCFLEHQTVIYQKMELAWMLHLFQMMLVLEQEQVI